MNVDKNVDGEWNPCQSGELEQIVRRVRSGRRNRVAFKLGSYVAVLTVVVVASVIALQRFGTSPMFTYGGISCEQTRANMNAYSMGQLAPDLAKRIETHLAECDHCGRRYREMTANGDPTANRVLPHPRDHSPLRAESTVIALAVENKPTSR